MSQPAPTRIADGTLISALMTNVEGHAALVRFIQAYLHADPQRCMIFQDVFATAEAPYDPDVPYFTYGAEVYRYVIDPQVEQAAIERVMQLVTTSAVRLFVAF